MPSPPSRRRRRHRSPTPYAVWLLGVFLSYGIMGAVLYAFVPPWWIWLVVGVGVLLLTWSREELGTLVLAIAIAVGINWSIESDLNFLVEWLVVTGLAVLIAGVIAIVMNQARSQLQATFETPRLVWILLGISALGLGSGILSVLLFNRLT
jgi:hypothetical protein